MNIKVNNINIYYEVIGKGRPIILLNPNSVNVKAMKYIAKKLENDFEVYIFHRRGCGKSERNCILTYEETAKDVYEFINKLKLNKPYLLGCSGGATVALNVAIDYPNSVSKLICCSGVSRKGMVGKPNYLKTMEKLPWYPGKKENDIFEKMNNEMKTLSEKELSKIKIPTLVVNGRKKDIVKVEEAKYISKNINNSQLIILEKEGHFSYMINCKWYNELKNF